MPLFECDKCRCVDNSALTNFWLTLLKENADKPQLCSECDPEIGKWHERFPRKLASEFQPGAVEYPAKLTPSDGKERQ